jgi:hemerythrin HHE cation binding domain-containing protein
MMAADHARLDRLLNRAAAAPPRIDPASYDAFRQGLLKHIAMEEKILLPAAQSLNSNQPLPIAARLRLDHGALAALLVPTPNPRIVAALNTILAAHNALEEGPDGVYETVARLAEAQASELLQRLQSAPAVPVSPFNDGPKVMPATRRALARAGYENLLPP